MPTRSPKPCKQFGCRALVTDGAYCPLHTKVKQKQVEETRLTSSERGYDYKWQQASKGFLGKHPLCECPDCEAGNIRVRPSEVLDHIIPHKLGDAIESGDPERIAIARSLFWDRNNWMAMNKQCHDKKTATQDGGFGRGRAGQKS
ncbi:HNH endonuclease signature motif containing protein [Methylophilus sp. Leaf414]|uniref:HNH endonuclease signature motif containing protein n=1 Tax=Methylophilus sp. Leaf414 TaxID=1736371 RepID=UPI0007015E4E|nr:HNH endonuclease signature motif containing protein [Methylophilus sp. Leaf414]KQT37691.1 hypothetical protein ASG24_01460 [Methylophilus sp. Leaf414]